MPDAYYASGANTLVFGDKSHGPRVGISAWFRNLQAHPQGVAYSIEASFLVRAFDPDSAAWELPEVNTIRIPYLYEGKPVRVQVARFPASWEARVIVWHIRYADMYGGRKLSLPVQTKGSMDGLYASTPSGDLTRLPCSLAHSKD